MNLVCHFLLQIRGLILQFQVLETLAKLSQVPAFPSTCLIKLQDLLSPWTTWLLTHVPLRGFHSHNHQGEIITSTWRRKIQLIPFKLQFNLSQVNMQEKAEILIDSSKFSVKQSWFAQLTFPGFSEHLSLLQAAMKKNAKPSWWNFPRSMSSAGEQGFSKGTSEP